MDTKAVIEELGLDVSQLTALEQEVKEYTYDIPFDAAKILMTKMWAMKSTTSEWITKSKRLTLARKRAMEKIHLVLKTECEEKTDAGKNRYASADEGYQAAVEAYDAAVLVQEFLNMKRIDLTEGHFMCKDLRREGSDEYKGSKEGEF